MRISAWGDGGKTRALRVRASAPARREIVITSRDLLQQLDEPRIVAQPCHRTRFLGAAIPMCSVDRHIPLPGGANPRRAAMAKRDGG
jgi:hypothetical protein